MRELHGVGCFNWSNVSTLKQAALLFDVVNIFDIEDLIGDHTRAAFPDVAADLDFLLEKKLVRGTSVLEIPSDLPIIDIDGVFESLKHQNTSPLGWEIYPMSAVFDDCNSRMMAGYLSTITDTVPICRLPFLPGIRGHFVKNEEIVLEVARDLFPCPDDTCAWQDILNFRDEARDKQWAFRRFLSTLGTKQQTEAEIRDDLEWSLNEYAKAMEVHHIKASQSFVDVFIISPLEIIENIVKLNWSKIAKGALDVKKRKVELLEAEMKAPGRECAYVFDARKRFGPR
jgi:hypothetical protein